MIGNRVRVKVVKNKVAPPFKEAEFDIMFGKGISRTGDVLDLAVKQDIIQKSGAWFGYNDKKIGQGRENAKIFLGEHPDIMDEVEKKVRESLHIGGTGLSEDSVAAEAVEKREDTDHTVFTDGARE